MTQRIKHVLYAAAVSGGIAFLQSLETLGAADWGTQPWWSVAAAVLTYAIAELRARDGGGQ